MDNNSTLLELQHGFSVNHHYEMKLLGTYNN